jgi:hypothetical protein
MRRRTLTVFAALVCCAALARAQQQPAAPQPQQPATTQLPAFIAITSCVPFNVLVVPGPGHAATRALDAAAAAAVSFAVENQTL